MERRIFLAVVLSFIVVYAYQALLIPPVPPASERARGAEDVRAPGDPPPEQTPPVGADRSRRDEQARVDDQARAIDQTRVGETSERDVVIETALVRAVFTNRGGRIREWFLKAYAENAEGRPVNLVPSDPPPGTQLPFSLRVDEGDITPTLNNALYKATVDGTQVIFDYENAAGLRVRKEFRLDPQSYVITFTASVQQGDRALNPFVQWGPGLGDVGSTGGGGSFFTGNYVQPPQAI
jgi:YidC/Oxa1 family membrane protein insertase